MSLDTLAILIVGALVCGFVLLIPAIKFIRGKPENRAITPQPLEVIAAKDYVTKEDCRREHVADKAERAIVLTALTTRESALDSTLREMDSRHETRTEDLRREFKSDIGGVHKRVDEVLRAVSRIEGKLDK